MTQATSHITSVGTVFVTVSDQDKAIDFYVNKLGFELRGDTKYGESDRWVEVGPPGGETAVALVPPMGDGPGPGQDLGFGYDTDDLEAAMAELRSRGVEFEEVPTMGGPVPPMAWFRDQDDNRVLLVQRMG